MQVQVDGPHQDAQGVSKVQNKAGLSHQRIDQLRHPEKHRARSALRESVKHGRIIKPSVCSGCREPSASLQGHHFDYALPLDVQWLCIPCHLKVHGKAKHPPNTVRFQFHIPFVLYNKVMPQADQAGVSLTAYVVAALERQVQRETQKAKR